MRRMVFPAGEAPRSCDFGGLLFPFLGGLRPRLSGLLVAIQPFADQSADQIRHDRYYDFINHMHLPHPLSTGVWIIRRYQYIRFCDGCPSSVEIFAFHLLDNSPYIRYTIDAEKHS